MKRELRALSAQPPEHLECRSMGHAWTHLDDRDHMRKHSNGQIVRFWRDERCMRCQAERSREVDLSGRDVTVQRSRMHYPPGYLIKNARNRVTRGQALGAQYGKEAWL